MNLNIQKTPFKIIFAGTSEFSADHLKTLISTNHKIVGVITQPDKLFGRKKQIIFSSTKILAQKFSIPIFQPESLITNVFFNQIRNLKADIMIIVSYGKLIPECILNIFPLGGINIHTSLLPKWRGSSPIQSAILNGDKKTGVTIIKINKNVDSGDILYSSSCVIKPNDTCISLQKRISKLSCSILTKVLKKIHTNNFYLIKQSNLATYSKKIIKKNALISWSNTAVKLERLIRAYKPWPICYFTINTTPIKIWSANVIMNNIHQKKYEIGEIILINKNGIQIQTKKNILNIQTLQLSGKKIMHAKNLCNTKHKWLYPGLILTNY